MNETKEILRNQFNKLPKDIQDAILSVDLRSKMELITRKNNLHIDQAGDLENEVVFVMLGLEHPGNLVSNIAKDIEVSEEKAEAIAGDLNREIFLKIRESLKKVFEERDKERGEEGGGNFLDSGLLRQKEVDEKEKIFNRKDARREIEDTEHHNLPIATNGQENRLEVRPPNEIEVIEKTASFSNGPISFKKMTSDVKKEKSAEINPFINLSASDEREQKIFKKVNRATGQHDIIYDRINTDTGQARRQWSPPKTEAIRTMEKDILKAKMRGMTNLSEDTIETNDSSAKELLVWQKALGLSAKVYKLTGKFPKEEIYGLTSQMRKASVSIVSNIAESRNRGNKKNSEHFLRMALGSLAELESQLQISKQINKTSYFDYSEIEEMIPEIMKMLNVIIKELNYNMRANG